jgi:type IV pilus assembly protein PilQ
MTPILGLYTAVMLGLGSVTSLAVVPGEGSTEVVIAVTGSVSVRDHVLQEPHRIVLDLSGTTHVLPQERFMNLHRGGVTSLRASQFQPQVVRIVIDLAAPTRYEVRQSAGEIRVIMPNGSGAFAAWSSGGRAPAATAAAARPQRRMLGEPVDMPQAAAAQAVVQPAPQPEAVAPPAAAVARPASRPAGAAASGSQVAAYAPPTAAIQQQPPISVSFRDTPILDVLATFADFAGRSIVAGTGVSGNITADIRNQPWDVALEAILSSHALAAREMPSGIILVESLAALGRRGQEEELITQAFPIRYISVDSVVNAMRPLLGDAGRVSRSPATNTLLVTAGRSTIERIQSLMTQLDARTPQVTIAAKIIFVDRSRLESFGIAYDLKDSRGNQLNQLVQGFLDEDGDGIISPGERTNADVVSLGGNSFALLGNANARVTAPSLRMITSLVLGRYSLIAFIDALQQQNFSDIQASPVITTLDHREAYIQVGQRTPIRVIDAQSAGGTGTNVPRARVETEETGTILRVTPHVTGNQVLLELHAEMSEPVLASSDVGFIFNTRQSETQILLNDGETAVISGLTRVQKDQVRSGIPLLMDLPLIGGLFRTTTTSESKQDLLIMITPYIVREGEA